LRAYLRLCPACGTYTLRDACPACNAPANAPGPARFSPEDRYGTYRRRLKRKLEAERVG
jgi:H/ACA ribonucleoprotein complex subunit 3